MRDEVARRMGAIVIRLHAEREIKRIEISRADLTWTLIRCLGGDRVCVS